MPLTRTPKMTFIEEIMCDLMQQYYQWEILSIYITCIYSPLINCKGIRMSRRMSIVQADTNSRVLLTMRSLTIRSTNRRVIQAKIIANESCSYNLSTLINM